jgi:hypothetical protein
MYLDSGSADKKKDYTFIKGVLDDAINGFVVKADLQERSSQARPADLQAQHDLPMPQAAGK